MATTHSKNGAPTFDAVVEQVQELNEQVLTATRKAGNVYVDSYEKAVERAIELELKFAELTPQEWLTNLIEAQAGFQRDLAGSYTKAARTLLK
jgi:hypothetical protein